MFSSSKYQPPSTGFSSSQGMTNVPVSDSDHIFVTVSGSHCGWVGWAVGLVCWRSLGGSVISCCTSVLKLVSWADKEIMCCLMHSSSYSRANDSIPSSESSPCTCWTSSVFSVSGISDCSIWQVNVLPFINELMTGEDIMQVSRLELCLDVYWCSTVWDLVV